MKTNRNKISNTKYPEDYKEVFNDYLLKKEIIEKYNRDENDKLKNKNHE